MKLLQKTYPHDLYLRVMQYTVFGFLILHFGQELFVPLSFAALISFVLYPVCTWLERKGLGRMTAILICLIVLLILTLGIVALLVTQFLNFLLEWPSLQEKFSTTLKQLSQFIIDSYGISSEQQSKWLTKLSNQSAGGIFAFLRSAISASAFTLVLAILIPVYAVLMLYYRHLWLQVIFQLFPRERKEKIRDVLLLTSKSYYNFIKGMAIVYLVVGILNSTGLLLLGVPHAILFGFIASILTFIPYIGIIVGSLLPLTLAWITYDSHWYALGVIGVFVFVQYLEAYIIFPWAVSNRMNVNTLIVLLAIILGGIIWGIAGMILFIPFVAIAKLLADHNPKLKVISMVLGQEKTQNK